MDENYLKPLETELTQVLLQLYEQHGVVCALHENIIIFPEQQVSSQLFLHNHPSKVGSVLKLDVILTIEEGRSIIESSVGIGESNEEAAKDAFVQFTTNSFHVLLSSFFTSEHDDEINVEEWNIGGQTFKVIFSNVCIRGQAPQPLPLEWFEQFVAEIHQHQFTKDVHWLRLFYGLANNEITVCEVLLDNDNWDEVQSKAYSFPLPPSEAYLSLRMFFVLIPKD